MSEVQEPDGVVQSGEPEKVATGCIEGFRCPECKAIESFWISGRTLFRVYEDGCGDHEDIYWDGKALCICGDCNHRGTVADFDTTYQADTEGDRGKAEDQKNGSAA